MKTITLPNGAVIVAAKVNAIGELQMGNTSASFTIVMQGGNYRYCHRKPKTGETDDEYLVDVSIVRASFVSTYFALVHNNGVTNVNT
jgi:hypothetical protein